LEILHRQELLRRPDTARNAILCRYPPHIDATRQRVSAGAPCDGQRRTSYILASWGGCHMGHIRHVNIRHATCHTWWTAAHVKLQLGFVEARAVVCVDHKDDAIHRDEILLPEGSRCNKPKPKKCAARTQVVAERESSDCRLPCSCPPKSCVVNLTFPSTSSSLSARRADASFDGTAHATKEAIVICAPRSTGPGHAHNRAQEHERWAY